jgi:8-oxo-dGTP pyrophosphatase MutT (NUDIX family)
MQQIPRPTSWRPGGPAPWADLAPANRELTLGGIRAALEAAGPPRLWGDESLITRASAVLAPLYEEDGQVKVVLTRRAQHLRSHRGEVSFPGGGQDPGEDLMQTALREAHEEVGLDPASVEIVGELDHLATIMSRSFIVPFVGFLPGRPELVPSPAEVELILHVPLVDLLDPEAYHEERWGLPPMDRPLVFFEIEGDTIWGATGAMLRNFLALVTGTPWRDAAGDRSSSTPGP